MAVGGYLQGGGYGFTSRQYGMACDNIVAAKVMLADGRRVNASADENADLLWGLCGGTGNNFGVALEYTYQLVPISSLWGFCLAWNAAQAPAAMLMMQNGYTKAGALPQLGWQGVMATIENKPTLLMMGLFNGARADGLGRRPSLNRNAATHPRQNWHVQRTERMADRFVPARHSPAAARRERVRIEGRGISGRAA